MLVILRSRTGKADVAAKALALAGRHIGYKSAPKRPLTAVIAVEADNVASALAAAGPAWVCVASGDAADVAAMLGDLSGA